MSRNFISEHIPQQIFDGVNNSVKESITLQYFNNNINAVGIPITVNSTTRNVLPVNAYTVLQNKLGSVSFKNGNTLVINQPKSFSHNIVVLASATAPNQGIFAMDVIDINGNSLKNNAFSVNNISPNNITTNTLNFIHSHASGEELQLRIGGGAVPGGGNIQIQIKSIQWIIIEN
jgi:hypothetical protein